MFRGVFLSFFDMHGGPVTVYRNYGTPSEISHTWKALQNTKTKHGGGDIFQFAERHDIEPGDILQREGSKDLWLVTDTQDFMDGMEYVNFDVSVVKATRTGAARQMPGMGNHIHIGGNVIGGVQVGTTNSSQNVNAILGPQDEDAFNRLRKAVSESQLDSHDKDEVNHTLDRVRELAKREPEQKTKASINEKLATVEKMIKLSEGLAKIALPLIEMVRARHG